MQARTLTPAAIFGHHVRYVVPLFQRPYVWNEQDQWAPLWADIRAVAEQLLEPPTGHSGASVAAHFLGAIVLDQPPSPTGYIAVRHVIDGQQRLTTLQLVLDAAQWVAQRYGSPMDAQALRILVLNDIAIAQQPQEVFKVWPTDRDQPAYAAAMDSNLPVTGELASSAVSRAHDFFVDAIEKWADPTGEPNVAKVKITALTQALREYIKVVVIDLESGDNAQVIFETLNHRGAPLLAADLIKNLVFQVAVGQGLDVAALYQRYWRELDSDYWRQKISRGRHYVPRIDIFVNYWLIMRSLREVPADRIFVEFRDHLMGGQPDIEALLSEFSRDARIYASLESASIASSIGRFRYRVIQAMDSAVVMPILLWLLRWPETALPAAQRDNALAAIESWLIRRAICRLTSKDINRLVVELLRELDASGPAVAGDATVAFLLAQTADSRLWPADKHVQEALQGTPVYTALLRGRLRMILEAIEDARRTAKSESGTCPRSLTVEHVLPRAWREHWSEGTVDPVERDSLLHTLGNLTLVNNKLNPALSNRPWTDQETLVRGLGNTGKRTELLRHSTLKINADLVERAPERWDEASIRARTAALTQNLVRIWARPDHGAPAPVSLAAAEKDPPPAAEEPPTDPAASSLRKYRPLTDWLLAQTVDALPVTFDDIEDILGQPLAPSARTHPPYWHSASNSLGKAILAGGFKASGVNLTEERATLVRR